MPSEKDNLIKAYKKALAAERRMELLNRKVINSIKKDIAKSTGAKGGTHNYNKKLDKAIKRKTRFLRKETLRTSDNLQEAIRQLAITTAVSASRIDISIDTVRKIVEKVDIDRFSKTLRPSFAEYQHDLLFHLKRSIGKGKGIESLAKGLLEIDPVKVDIPAYIDDIVSAARKAVRDPKDYAVFQAALNRHKGYINKLTRAGELGFQALGLRPAGRAFLRDIKKAVNDNTIDNVMNDWSRRKLAYIQKRVARTETSRAYHEALREYAIEADHIKGVEVRLSESHPEPDICDELAGVYIFGRHGNNFPMPPHHPQCICHIVYLFYQDFLDEEQAA
jgi:hypothetical protein